MMKKSLCFVLAIVCVFLASCRVLPPEETTEKTSPPSEPPSQVIIPVVYDQTPPAYGVTNDDPSNTDEVKITSIGRGSLRIFFSTSIIKMNQATDLITLLNGLQTTNTNAEAMSDEELPFPGEVPEFLYDFYYSPIWLETNDKIYRITWNKQRKDEYIPTIALVETHYGKGIYLEVTDELIELVKTLDSYWPYDYWYGKYDPSKSEVLTMEHLYARDSAVNIVVKSITFDKVEKDYERIGRIVLEVTVPTDQELAIGVKCQQSDDVLGSGSYGNLTLQAHVPQTVELTFKMSRDYYYITIFEDLTYIRILFWNMDALYSE